MLRFLIVVAIIWIVLMPPFFTDGACSAEFDKVEAAVKDNRQALATLPSAQTFWGTTDASVQLVTDQQCQKAKPRFMGRCFFGDLLYVKVPVKNKICHYYRDSDIRVQMQYDGTGRLVRLQTDMDPYKYFSIPGTSTTVYWGK